MKYLTENKYWNIVEDYNLDKLLYLLIDRPDRIFTHEIKWRNDKSQTHRDYDFPAYVYKEGTVWWEKNDRLYRACNKPYTIRCDGTKEYVK